LVVSDKVADENAAGKGGVPDGLLSVDDVAAILSVNRETIVFWKDIGILKPTFIARNDDIRFKPEEVYKFLT
jgi:predicted site-specific integrase-resolvase